MLVPANVALLKGIFWLIYTHICCECLKDILDSD